MTPQQVRRHLARRRSRLVVFGRVDVEDGLIVFAHLYLVTHMTESADPIVCVARFDPSVVEPVTIWYGLKLQQPSQDISEQCARDLSDLSKHGPDGLRPMGDHLVTCNQMGQISIEQPQMLQILSTIWAIASQSAYDKPQKIVLLHRLRALIDQANSTEAARHLLP